MATGYNIVAIRLAAGVLGGWGINLSPAVGALLMSISTIVVAITMPSFCAACPWPDRRAATVDTVRLKYGDE